MRTIIIFISVLFTITACSKLEQADNSVPKLIWKTSLLDGKESFSFSPVIYKDIVIYGIKYARLDRNEKPKIVAFNKNTGEKAWEWNNAQSESESYSGHSGTYTHQNVLVMSTGARTYAIDMETGKSLWATKDAEGGNRNIVGVNDKIYHVQNALDKTQDVLCKANVLSGNWEPVYKAQTKNRYTSIEYYKVLDKDSDGKTYLYFIASNVDLNFTVSETHLLKLDIQTDSIVLDKILTNSSTVVAADDKRIYVAGTKLLGLDKKTGEVIKEYALPRLSNNSYHPGICIVKNNKLFAPTNYPRFICYDTESTNTLWSEDGISTSSPSRLLYHDGVVYYTSGSDGNLHAIDENGKRLWKAASPDRKAAGDGIFDDPITIDAAQNRIYLSTFYSACCYETIKK